MVMRTSTHLKALEEWQQEKAQLLQHIEHLTRELQAANAQYDRATRDLTEAHRQRYEQAETLKQELAARDRTIEALQKALGREKVEHAEALGALRDQHAQQVQQLQEQIQALQQQAQLDGEALAGKEAELASLHSALLDQQARIQVLEQELERAAYQCHQAEQKASAAMAREQEARQQAEQARADRDRVLAMHSHHLRVGAVYLDVHQLQARLNAELPTVRVEQSNGNLLFYSSRPLSEAEQNRLQDIIRPVVDRT